MRHSWLVAGALAVGALVSSAAADVTVVIDYTHDSFFASNATAKAALNAAAADVSAALTSALGATTDTSTGVSGGSTATFNFEWSFFDPEGGSDIVFNPTVLPADQVRIFAGGQNLTGGVLGVGGPGGFGLGGGGTFSNQSDWNQAVANLSANSTANQGRGGGPVIYNITGQFGPAGMEADFDFNVGSNVGSFSVDSVGTNWHFDHTTPVGASAIDLYSVALHEILHALGFGAADSWDVNVSGVDDWLGAEVIALLGSGVDVLHSDSAHIAAGTMSRRLGDLQAQEVVMDPDIAPGQRKFLTELDLAFLRDIGWQTVVVPEPSSVLILIGAAGGLLLRRRRAA